MTSFFHNINDIMEQTKHIREEASLFSAAAVAEKRLASSLLQL